MPRIGSRIRTVAADFPSVGPTFLVGTRTGAVPQVTRYGRNAIVRGRAAGVRAAFVDVPQRQLVLGPPYGTAPLPPPAAPTGRDGGCTDCG